MRVKRVTRKVYNEVKDKYGVRLYRFIFPFTEDEEKAIEIAREILWEIPALELNAKTYFGETVQLMMFSRKYAISWLKKDPSFDPWAQWKRKLDHYHLDDLPLSPLHKKVFNLCHFGDIEYLEIAERFGMTGDEVSKMMRETLHAITLAEKQ